MKFHPTLSIFLGFLFILFGMAIALEIFRSNPFTVFTAPIYFIIIILGGFIASYLSNKKRILYGSYLGIVTDVFLLLFMFAGPLPNSIYNGYLIFLGVVSIAIITLLFTSIGGLIAVLINDNDRKLFKVKYWKNGIDVFPAIIIGIITTFIIYSGLIFASNNSSQTAINYTILTIGVIAYFIGGLVTILLANDRKIKYGLITGIITFMIGGLLKLYAIMSGFPILNESYLFMVIFSILYIISAAFGGYIAIIMYKNIF